jgi:hypothetical protein
MWSPKAQWEIILKLFLVYLESVVLHSWVHRDILDNQAQPTGRLWLGFARIQTEMWLSGGLMRQMTLQNPYKFATTASCAVTSTFVQGKTKSTTGHPKPLNHKIPTEDHLSLEFWHSCNDVKIMYWGHWHCWRITRTIYDYKGWMITELPFSAEYHCSFYIVQTRGFWFLLSPSKRTQFFSNWYTPCE